VCVCVCVCLCVCVCECVCVCVCVALDIQHAQRMRRIVMCGLFGSTCFPTLSHKRKISDKNQGIYNVFWLPLQILCERFLIIRRLERGMIINVYWSSCEIFIILIDFNEVRTSWTDFRKILKYQLSCKSVEWELNCSMRTDGWTFRHDELNSRLSQFCESTWKLVIQFSAGG